MPFAARVPLRGERKLARALSNGAESPRPPFLKLLNEAHLPVPERSDALSISRARSASFTSHFPAKKKSTRLTDLPPEVLLNVFARLEKRTLMSLRLIKCREVTRAASECLFAEISTTVFGDLDLAHRLRGLISSQKISGLVKAVKLILAPGTNPFDHVDPFRSAMLQFKYACDNTVLFASISTIFLDLTDVFFIDPTGSSDNENLAHLALFALGQLLKSIGGDDETKPPPCKIRNLELINVPPLNITELTGSDWFGRALGSVERLGMTIGPWSLYDEDNELVADYPVENELVADYPADREIHSFVRDLVEIYSNGVLRRHMAFGFAKYVGIYPKFDLNRVCRSLFTLKLCKVAFSERFVKQLIELKELRTLWLIDPCLIITMHTNHSVDQDRCPIRDQIQEEQETHEFDIRWDTLLDMICAGLLKLEDFRFAERRANETSYQINTGLSSAASCEWYFKEGIFPMRYLEYFQGHMVYTEAAQIAHENSRLRDTVALHRLPMKIRMQIWEKTVNAVEPADNEI